MLLELGVADDVLQQSVIDSMMSRMPSVTNVYSRRVRMDTWSDNTSTAHCMTA